MTEIQDYIAHTKSDLTGRQNVQKAFDEIRDMINLEVEVIRNADAKGDSVVPELHYGDIANGKVPNAQVKDIRHRGCAIVRGVFPVAQATEWNQMIGAYLEDNDYLAKAKEKAGMDNYFGDLADALRSPVEPWG